MTSAVRTAAAGVVGAARWADRAVAVVLLLAVRTYQLLVSPLLGPVCRYAPSCSSYGAQALAQRGAVVGTALTARRLLRCHPWASGGWDPVPERVHRHGRGHGPSAPAAPAADRPPPRVRTTPQPSPEPLRTP